MTAASGRIAGPKPYGDHNPIPWGDTLALAASVAPFRNWLLGVVPTTGYVVAQAAGVTDLVSAGFADRDEPSSAAAGRSFMLARQQFVSGFLNSEETNDALLSTDYAAPFWIVDNQTVGKLSNFGGVNRSLGGLAFGIDPDTDTPILYPGPVGWTLGRVAVMADNAIFAAVPVVDSAASDTIAERVIPTEKLHGKVSAIQLTGAAIAADNTDYITLTVSKRDGAGGGAVVLGTYDSRAANQGALTAFTPKAFALSAVAGALNILETDVITITEAKGGAGKSVVGAVRIIGKVG
jgi:hypothetical protein